MTELTRVVPGLLKPGKPLPWPVYDRYGQLLVNQGYVVRDESQLEKLYERGYYESLDAKARARDRESKEDRKKRRLNPFSGYSLLLYDLENVLSKITNAEPDAEQRLERLARNVIHICEQDTDASIALVHIYAVEPTAYEQNLFYAIVCWLAVKSFEISEKRRLTIIKAALVANVALVPYLDKLNNSKSGLSEAQRQVVQKHPELSAKALEAAGITSKACIEIVRQHHEQSDGKGYPMGLSGDQVMAEAKAIAIAERYTAMITKRAYRERLKSDEAMEALEGSMAEDRHYGISKRLCEHLTCFPPGVMVELENGEIAVVTHRGRQPDQPHVKAIANKQGKRYLGPLVRDTAEQGFSVSRILVPKNLPAIDVSMMWGYA